MRFTGLFLLFALCFAVPASAMTFERCSKVQIAYATDAIEGAREIVSCKTPAVVSCHKGLNEPRYANLKGIMAAKKKPFVEQPAQLGARGMEIVALTLPAPRAAGKIVGNGADAVPALIAALRNEAKAL
jgi:electron transfer flavoprotein beta subunit